MVGPPDDRGGHQRPDGWGNEPPQLGLRRVNWVRIEVNHDRPRRVVAGLAHRGPVHIPVPVGTALALWRSGVPTVFHTSSQPGAPVRLPSYRER